MNKRILAIVMASVLAVSMTGCDNLKGLKPDVTTTTEEETTTEETTEATTEETTTVEETTTSEETTSEESTTSEETTTTSEETTSTSTTATTKAPTKKPAAKPSSVPKGWYKTDVWGQKYKGVKRYVICKGNSYKAWHKGKWVKVYFTQTDVDEVGNYIDEYFFDKKHKKKYAEYWGAP